MHSKVSLTSEEGAHYPLDRPFHPSEGYPEYPFPENIAVSDNAVYRQVRKALFELGLDQANYDTPSWNPMGAFVEPGMKVLVKPNLVLDKHPKGGDLLCLTTHGSVIRALLDYVYIALNGEGEVVVGDSPIQGTSFEVATEAVGLSDVLAYYESYTSFQVRLVDFRQVIARMDDRFHVKEWVEVKGDPAGYVTFDLGQDSMLTPIAHDSKNFRVSNYKSSDTMQYHNERSHKYIVSKSILDADVLINVPKMKTHCKAGVTLALKNFVGTVGRKQCLAHHRYGGTLEGGDEYPKFSTLKKISEWLERKLDGHAKGQHRVLYSFWYRVNERLIKSLGINQWREGCWHGNDTVWRMVIDLVRIARYGREDGTLDETPQRTIFTVIDGIVGGENEGPLEATPNASQSIFASLNPVAAELAATTFMGLDYRRIPLVRNATTLNQWPLLDEDVGALTIRCEGKDLTLEELASSPVRKRFTPAAGWVGHIELP